MTNSQVSASGLPVVDAILAVGNVVTISALNLQRNAFDHMLKGAGADLIDSLAETGFQSTRGMPSVEPYSDRLHGHLWQAALQSQLTSLQGFVIAKDQDAKSLATNEAALKWFKEQYQDADGKWKRPTHVTVDGNSRLFGIYRANGRRIANGLEPITELPVKCFTRSLSMRERIREQIRANSQVGQSAPSTEQVAKTLGAYIQAMVKEGELAPLAPSDYSAILATTQSQIIDESSDSAKKVNNLVNATRPAVVLDYLYPALRILERLGAAADLPDGQKRLTFNVAFAQSKMAAYNELLRRAVPSQRTKENDKRRAACTKSGQEFIPASDARHAAEIDRLIAAGNATPYTANPCLELTEPTLEEIATLVNGEKKKPGAAKPDNLTALTDQYAGPNKSKGEVLARELLTTLRDADTKEALKQVKELEPVLESNAKLAGNGAIWLERVTAIQSERHTDLADLLECVSELEPAHWELLLSIINVPVDKVEAVSKYVAKQLPKPIEASATTN